MNQTFNPSDHRFKSPEFQRIIQNAIEFVDTTPVIPLPPKHSFVGSGVYLLYYLGDFVPYNPIADANRRSVSVPIYVGKAVPVGWRQARRVDTNSATLYNRLRKHARSINSAGNLNVRDFICRMVILQDAESSLISVVESELIRSYQPLWNSLIDGFGNNDPGVNRYGQLLSEWDVIHPGRSWEQKWKGPRPDYETLISTIRNYFG